MSFRAFDSSKSLIDDFDDHTSARRAAEAAGHGAYVENEEGRVTAVVPKPYGSFYVDDTPHSIGIPVAWSPGN